MKLGELLINSGMMANAYDGDFTDLCIRTESEEETELRCTVACPLLYYLKDIEVQSFQPDYKEPHTMEIWLTGYKGDGDHSGKYWDELM